MILKVPFLVLIITWSEAVSAASYSKVYVQNGVEVSPFEYDYLQYPANRNTYLARLAASPYNPVPVSPCAVPPCLAVAAPVQAEKIVAYNNPVQSVPVVVAEPKGYEYAYVVYDEGTGDQKSQRELSDGSVVKGEYSFLQPDGYIRQVKYIADEQTGFNAIVKSYLPDKKTVVQPCVEVKEKPEATESETTNEEATSPEKSEEASETNENKNDEMAEKPESTENKKPTETEEKSKEEEKVSEKSENEEKPVDEGVKLEKLTESTPQEIEVPVVATIPVIPQPSVVSYSDIMRCIDAYLRGSQVVPTQQMPSPISYIVLNKPC